MALVDEQNNIDNSDIVRMDSDNEARVCVPDVQEPPKKKTKFSISSILGEENPRSNKEDQDIPHPVTSSPSPTSPLNHSKHLERSPSPLTHSKLFDTALKQQQSLLSAFPNPELARLYRWPLLWSPWLGMQGVGPPGAPRPTAPPTHPFLQHRHEGVSERLHPDVSKDPVEAGEIVRPVAFKRPFSDTEDMYKNSLETNEPVDDSHEDEMLEVDDDSDHSRHEDDDEDGLKSCERKKKTRTVFSRSQIFQLETMFDMKRYLSSSERAGLAKALNMTETQVKIWFQNRRNKWKRQIAAEMEAANMSQVTGQRLMQLPYMYSSEELSRGLRSSLPPLPSSHPVVPPSVHQFYGSLLRTHST